MGMIITKDGEVEESLLQVRRDVTEIQSNGYHAVSTATEYCYDNCNGEAHATGTADSEGMFCNQHVKRSVHVDVIQAPGMEPVIQGM